MSLNSCCLIDNHRIVLNVDTIERKILIAKIKFGIASNDPKALA